MRHKEVDCRLFSIYFDSPQLGIQKKQIAKNLRPLIERYAQF